MSKLDAALDKFTRALKDNGWRSEKCSVCFEVVWSKRLYANGFKPCCVIARPKFPRSRTPTLGEVRNATLSYLAQLGYEQEASLPITAKYGKNLFIGTGGQINDPYIFSGESLPQLRNLKRCVAQPVIRLSYLKGDRNTGSTAFVNICTELINASVENFYKMLDDWLTVLSKLHFHVSSLDIKVETSSDNWGIGSMDQIVVTIKTSGIEIANFNYCLDMPTFNSGNCSGREPASGRLSKRKPGIALE